jgi:cyclin-dependent kinase 8/11
MTQNAFNLFEKLLIYDPEKRITSKEALLHPYFSDEPKPSHNVFIETKNNEIPIPDRVDQKKK